MDARLESIAIEFAERMATVKPTARRVEIASIFWMAVHCDDLPRAARMLGQLDETIEMDTLDSLIAKANSLPTV